MFRLPSTVYLVQNRVVSCHQVISDPEGSVTIASARAAFAPSGAPGVGPAAPKAAPGRHRWLSVTTARQAVAEPQGEIARALGPATSGRSS